MLDKPWSLPVKSSSVMPFSKTRKKPFSQTEHKFLPSSLEGERFILGALLAGQQKTWDEVMEILKSEDFHKPAHQDIFSCMETLYKSDRSGDILRISEELKKNGKLESSGGSLYLAELVEESASPVSAEECSHIIREKSILRKIIHLCSDFRQRAISHDFFKLEHFIDSLEKDLFQFTENLTQKQLLPVPDMVAESLKRLEDLQGKRLSVTGISTNFSELDHLTSGFQSGELSIIAARPSMGKTAFSLNIALNASLNNKKVAFFSVEMAKEQILMRLLSLTGKVPLSHLRTGQITTQDWDNLIVAGSKLNDVTFFLDDSSFLSPFEIRSRARKLKSQHGLDLLIVDYLQLMSLKATMESREREVSEISRLLKSLAKELQIPVVALSQLNRGVEGRVNRRPLLSDLRESGSLEQDADVIMMLYRDDYYNDNSEKAGLAEVILNKQRNGPTGKVTLKWDARFGLFENYIPIAENTQIMTGPHDVGRPPMGNSPMERPPVRNSPNDPPPF